SQPTSPPVGNPAAVSAAQPTVEITERIGDPWPLGTCVVSGQKLGSMGEPIIKLHEGREVRLCCAGCIGGFESAPDKFLAVADKVIIATQKAHFPLDHCMIDTAEKLTADESENSYHVIYNRLF